MKKKPEDFLLYKFVNELIDRKARVRVDGRTYQEGHNLNIRDLVGDLLDMKKNDVYKITRSSTLQKKNSRKFSASDDQETVINQLDFYLDTEDLQPNPKLKLTPADFFISGEGKTLAIYPGAPQWINKKIYEYIETEDLLKIAHTIGADSFKRGPFYPLIKKIKKAIFSGDDSFRSTVKNNLQSLADEYRSIFLKNLQAVIESASLTTEQQMEANTPIQLVIPGYNWDLEFPFTECFKNEIDIPADPSQTEFYKDENTWFDSYRYYRLKTLMPKLLQMNVQGWPKWVLEHVILTEIEYQVIYNHFQETAYKEVKNNVRYSLLMSSDGAKFDIQEDIDDIHSLGNKLVEFKFPGKIENLINIHRGTILEGPYSKFPKDLVARNKHSTFEIKFEILEALIGYFHKRICKGIGFSFPEEHKQLNEYAELANKLIEETSENE